MIKARRAYSIIFLSFLSIVVFSQTNLVPNPSFEVTVQCPSNDNNITDCGNWMNFGATPDYYHGCGVSGLSVPNAAAGYQYARTGMGMAGLISWCHPISCSAGPNYREFIGAVLTNTLQVGVKYFISFFINWSGYLYGWRQYATNKIGLRFSTVSSNTTNPAPINNFAHLKTNVIYQDTVNWLKISGSFIADSVYKYILIGNFFNDTNTDTLSYPGPVFGSMAAYYYIDDVCVSTDSLYALNWTGITNSLLNEEIRTYPNPVEDFLFLKGFDQFSEFKLYDLVGNEVKFEVMKDKLDLINICPGIYFLSCKRNREVYKCKILKK
ncbi:MAG: T9SS type A sorting domain-containing protein [Bacteroidia bacterium]|nr:T9SS type A sorting domain-containing protein [Bacteroidia bacterium]